MLQIKMEGNRMKKGLISFISGISGVIAGAGIISKFMGKSLARSNNMSDKHLALFLMMNQWVKVKQEGKNLSDYFKENGFHTIAVYGMSYAGETLIEELSESDIAVAYGIDKEAGSLYSDIELVTLDDDLKEVDAVVVTAITFYEEIAEKLEKKLKCPVISLEDILYEV